MLVLNWAGYLLEGLKKKIYSQIERLVHVTEGLFDGSEKYSNQKKSLSSALIEEDHVWALELFAEACRDEISVNAGGALRMLHVLVDEYNAPVITAITPKAEEVTYDAAMEFTRVFL